MKLLTAAIIKKLEKNPLYSTESQNVVPVIVKFFTPDSSWTWYATEGSKLEDGDWMFFGLVDGHEKELGNFLLSELQSVRGGFGLKIERDIYFDGMVLDKTNNEVRKA
jgi:hypothetical protein